MMNKGKKEINDKNVLFILNFFILDSESLFNFYIYFQYGYFPYYPYNYYKNNE